MTPITLARVPMRVWNSYLRTLNSNPVRTKMATSVAAALIGDSLAQNFSAKQKKLDTWQFDYLRTLRLMLFNAGMGFLGHHYYGALDRRVGVTSPTSPQTIVTKVGIDQLIWSPICTFIFYAYKTTAEGRPVEYFSELENKLWPTLKAGWSLWPAAHVINFAFVPTQHRILYANVVSVAGTFLLSRAAAGDYSKGKYASEKPNEVLFDGVSVKYD